MKKPLLQNLWLWIGLAVLYLSVHFFIRPAFIHSFPESSQVPLLLKSNSALTEAFGSVQSIDFNDTNNEVNWSAKGLFGKGSYTGTYQFNITGAKRSGVILVHWKSTADHQAQVVSIDEITPAGEYLSTVWKGPIEQSLPAETLSVDGQARPRVTVIDVCIYFFAGILVISLTGSLIYFWSRRHHEV